jgi:hypothetical protein
MTFTYGTSRKIGVGFNHPRVLGGAMQFDWRRTWDFARRLTRLKRPHRKSRPWHQPLSASVVETHRRMVQDK